MTSRSHDIEVIERFEEKLPSVIGDSHQLPAGVSEYFSTMHMTPVRRLAASRALRLQLRT